MSSTVGRWLLFSVVLVFGFLLSITPVLLDWIYSDAPFFWQWLWRSGREKHLFPLLLSLGTSLIGACLFWLALQLFVEKPEAQKADASYRRHVIEVAFDLLRCGESMIDMALVQLRSSGALYDGSLKGRSFAGVDLVGRDLTSAVLNGVDFSDSNLSKTKLVGAKLEGATLTGATLTGADFSFSCLLDSEYDADQLSGVWALVGCTLKDGSLYDGSLNLKGDSEFAAKRGFDLSKPKERRDFFRDFTA